MAVLSSLEYLFFLIMIVIASIVIVNVDLVESILAAESVNRGEFQITIVILGSLFNTIAFVASKR